MPSAKNKITIRQLFVIFVIVTLSPAIRLFPQICSEYGGIAGWTAPIIASTAMFILLAVLNAFFRKVEVTDLSDVFELSLGKIAGKLLSTLYLLWVIILFALYIRYYADRLLSSIYPNTNIRFFLLAMLAVVYYVSRGRIESFARFGEFVFLIFIIIFIMFYILLIPTVEINNLLPLTYYDVWPAVKAAYPVIGIWGYITLLLFLGEHVIKKEQFKKNGKQTILLLVIMTTLLIIFVIGTLGYQLAERMPLPFFAATKLVSLVESLDRMEAILLTIWVISDFIIITVFALLIMNITKKLFQVTEIKYFASPIVLLGYAGSLFLATSSYEMESFSSIIALPVNILLCIVVPIVVFCVGKIRKKI